MDVTLALREFGLSEKESQTYLALLPLGACTLQNIAQHLEFPRTTVYNSINYLLERGLVSKIIIGGVAHYRATDPKKLVAILDEKRKLVLAALPELAVLQMEEKFPSHAELYDGTRGLFTILSDIFAQKQQTYYFGSYSRSLQALKHLPEHARTIRVERNIPAKIVIDPYDDPTFHAAAYKKITEMRVHNALKEFPCMVFIYGKKVAIYTVKGDLVGVIIENAQVAQAMRLVFEMYWKEGKPMKL